jgi:quercetin dioxygenase-like cupin family protein
MPNLKWSFADSHMRIEERGWARETTARELPISKTIAGVNMRLKAGAVRELHRHKEAEWSYMLKGKARITAVDELGRTFADDVSEGDLWYFPPGIPHSIQGLDSDIAPSASSIPRHLRHQRRSPRPWSSLSQVRFANCTGIRMPTNGSTMSKAKVA